MKKILLLFIIFAMFACNKIVLKKTILITVPFSKIDEGSYILNFYKIDYPKDLKSKEEFLNNFGIILQKLLLQDKKLDILMEQDFFTDFEKITEGSLIEQEEIFGKVASSLTVEEVEIIKSVTNKEQEFFKDTIQETLNLQVYFCLKILKREDEFDNEKVYSELFKEGLINKIKLKRKETIKVLDKTNINIMVYINDIYEEEKNETNKCKYWYEKDISFNKEVEFVEKLKGIKKSVFINKINEEDINGIIDKEITINNKCIIFNNKKYNGYRHLNNMYLFFINGEEKVNEYKNYEISINLKQATFEEVLKKEEKYILTDFIGGK